ISMAKACAIVMSTSLLAGILEGLDALAAFTAPLGRFAEKAGIFPAMVLTSTLVSCCFCNQSVAIVMSEQLMSPHYRRAGLSATTMAIDIENSAVMIAGLVPWSIAVAIPLAMMEVGSSAILFAALLYLTPLCYLFTRRFHLAAQQERS
ncbi:MAG: hypothetical protein IJF36_05160, partial [Oscillibacter sp.]|nr:hypothetical protein [Oscillibacter sp.]